MNLGICCEMLFIEIRNSLVEVSEYICSIVVVLFAAVATAIVVSFSLS